MGSTAHDPAKRPAALLSALTPHLSRWVQTRMSADDEFNLSMRQLTALQCIGEPETTLGDVARHLNVTPAVVTGLIDRLERRGYVRRVGSSFDRRRVHIELTSDGADVRDQAEERLAADLQAPIAALPPEQIDALTNGLEVLDAMISRMEAERNRRNG